MSAVVRVELPASLCLLAGLPHQVQLTVSDVVTQRSVLDALEASHPMLKGTIRDQATKLRRPFIRFFACEEDLSHLPIDAPLPHPVTDGTETFLIIGAIAGG